MTKSFLLFIFLAIGFPSYSQLWLTGGMDIHRYTDTGPMDLKDEPIYPTVRMGFDIYAPKEKKLGFGGELALIGRRFSQELSGYDFEYRFRGMQALVYMQYRITSEIYIDAGLSGAFFGSSLRRNGNRKRMASGFRSHDVGWAVGGGYHISNRFSVGYRFTQWKIEMLEYRIIDDLGYFGPNQRAILASNHLIYLRFHLISLDL